MCLFWELLQVISAALPSSLCRHPPDVEGVQSHGNYTEQLLAKHPTDPKINTEWRREAGEMFSDC